MQGDPVLLSVACERLGKREGTIRVWGTRYGVRRVKMFGTLYWDYNDLATIDACIWRGEPVPATPQERDHMRQRRAASYV